MLVLTRKEGQKLHIGDDIVVTVVSVKGNRVKLGFDAPQTKRILRREVATAEDESKPRSNSAEQARHVSQN